MPGGRPRTFDEDEALDRAMRVFWARGYERTSLPELLDAMGIARQSLYHAFGDKRALFLRCLDRYAAEAARPTLERLRAPGRAIDALLDVVRDWGRGCTQKPQLGCMIASAPGQFSGDDAEVLAALAKHRDAAEAAFRDALARARDEGDLPDDADPETLARALLAMQFGIGVLRRLPRSKKLVDAAVRQAERLLGR